MNNRVIEMEAARYTLPEKALSALNKAAAEPITPFGYAYVGCERKGSMQVRFSQQKWNTKEYSSAASSEGAREFPVYLAPQVRELLTEAFMAGVREAVPSRWQEFKGGTTKSIAQAADRYASKVLGHE